MAGVQSIVDQIINDAKKQAESILETASRQAEDNERIASKQADTAIREIELKAGADCREEERRFRAIMDLESRKELLAKKRLCMEKAFEKAKQEILDLDDAGYESFLYGLLQKTGAEGGRVWYARRDERFFNEAFFAKAKAEISGDLEPGGVNEDLVSGFMLVCGDITINCSLDSVIKQARDQLESEVARILFER